MKTDLFPFTAEDGSVAFPIGAASAKLRGSWMKGYGGIRQLTTLVRFTPGTFASAPTCTVLVQGTLDQGATFYDILKRTFVTTADVRMSVVVPGSAAAIQPGADAVQFDGTTPEADGIVAAILSDWLRLTIIMGAGGSYTNGQVSARGMAS